MTGFINVAGFDIEFCPRSEDDAQLCQVRKGVTKYVLDRCDYNTHESATFMDAAIGGLGWFFVGYELDEESGDGEAYVRREDPFFRAKWTDKDELKSVYTEHANEIDAQFKQKIFDA